MTTLLSHVVEERTTEETILSMKDDLTYCAIHYCVKKNKTKTKTKLKQTKIFKKKR